MLVDMLILFLIGLALRFAILRRAPDADEVLVFVVFSAYGYWFAMTALDKQEWSRWILPVSFCAFAGLAVTGFNRGRNARGIGWAREIIHVGGNNSRAVFGAALLLILALYAAAIVLALALATLVMGGQAVGDDAGPDLSMAMWVALPLMLLVMLLVPILLGGLMHVIREAEAGRPVRARDVFMPVRQARGRRLALLGLLQVALAGAGAALMMAVAGADYWRDYVAAMQSAMQGGAPAQMPQPRNAGLLFLLQLVFNYFSYAMMLFAIPLMLFSGSGFVDALRDSLRAAVRYVVSHLAFGILFIFAALITSLFAVLVGNLASMVGGFIHQALGGLLLMVVMLGFASVVLVVVAGAAYLAWRDTFGDAATPPAAPAQVHGFEA